MELQSHHTGRFNSRTKDLRKEFKIKELLYRGDFSTVRRCLRRTDKKPFGLKIIRKKRRKMLQFLQKLLEQMDLTEKLEHPNLCKTLRTYNTPNYIHMVMEFCSSYNIFEYLHAGDNFCEKQAAEVIKQISKGLTYLHENKIVHRDVKPENVLVFHHPETGAVLYKIISFGFAKNFEQGCSTLCGSPEYVAPEIIQANSIYFEQVDFWALGVLMYTMLCGYLPFYDDDQKKTYRLIRKHALQFDEEIWDTISKLSTDLIKKLLRTNTRKRYNGPQVLAHEWVNNDLTEPLDSGYIRMYYLRQRMVRGVKTILSVIKMKDTLVECEQEMTEKEEKKRMASAGAGAPTPNKNNYGTSAPATGAPRRKKVYVE